VLLYQLRCTGYLRDRDTRHAVYSFTVYRSPEEARREAPAFLARLTDPARLERAFADVPATHVDVIELELAD